MPADQANGSAAGRLVHIERRWLAGIRHDQPATALALARWLIVGLVVRRFGSFFFVVGRFGRVAAGCLGGLVIIVIVVIVIAATCGQQPGNHQESSSGSRRLHQRAPA
jgi:hypothetical protein